MMKKRFGTVLWLLISFVSGALLILLCWFGTEKVQEMQRYKSCKNRDYSFLDRSEALSAEQNERGTAYYFQSIELLLEGEETIFIDDWSGQMRQYHKGVLFLLFVAEYDRSLGPTYQQYQIRSLEECEALSELLKAGNTAELKAAGVRTWQMESGETFAD